MASQWLELKLQMAASLSPSFPLPLSPSLRSSSPPLFLSLVSLAGGWTLRGQTHTAFAVVAEHGLLSSEGCH